MIEHGPPPRAGAIAHRPSLRIAGAFGIGSLVSACGIGRADAGRASLAAYDSTPARFTIDATRRFPISRYIYGINTYGAPADSTVPTWPRGVTLSRFGGNRLTTYNWQNNASNAGRDWNFQNDAYLGGGMTPGGAVRERVRGALDKAAGVIVTIPMLGYVAHDMDGTTVGTDPGALRARLATRFVPSAPSRAGTPWHTPVAGDGTVYQDEFVAWLTRAFPRAARSDTTPIFFALDNEPDLWGSTHEEIMPNVAGKMALMTYDTIIDRTEAYARAIKAADPEALVFGPGTATWTGMTSLARWPTPDPRYGHQDFLDVYLDRLRDAERRSGRRLLDVLDVHWYPEVTVDGHRITDDMTPQPPAVVEARLQAPRSLWDSTYDERSWVTRVNNGPVALLPRLRAKIAAHYPGTKLAVTEYYYGRGGDIAGGVTQADVLGIFGREGVFAATLWPLANLRAVPYGGSADRAYQYVVGAFQMYRDYDGHGAAFGQIGLAARSSDPAMASVYASTDAVGASRLVLVMINKQPRARAATVAVAARHGWRTAEVYTLTDAAPGPRRAPDVTVGGATTFRYTMPPLSVNTLVLRP